MSACSSGGGRAAQQAQVAAQGRERSAQFVGDIRDKVALHLEGMFHFLEGILQTGQHGIEGACQLTDFIRRTGVIDTAGEIALIADGLCGLCDALDGTQRDPGKATSRSQRQSVPSANRRSTV